MKINYLRGLVEWSLMAALVLGTGAMARAQQDQDKDQSQPEGRVVQIGPADTQPAPQDDGPAMPPPQPAPDTGHEPGAPQYWIGLVGGPVSPALRAQLDIPDHEGVMVRDVVPDSPAAKAGLKKYDVLLRANDNDLADMSDLVDLVRTTGEQHGQFSLEVLRRGQRETVWITPAERPERERQPGGFGSGDVPGNLRRYLENFRMNRNNRPFEFRSFGPSVIVGGGFGLAQLPNGVSVVMRKQGDEPAHITVKRGDETWEVVGDDPKSLDQLPDDLRPFVEQMIGRNGPPNFVMPDMPETPHPLPVPQFDDHRFRERLDRMEKQLQKLQEKLPGQEQQSDQEAS